LLVDMASMDEDCFDGVANIMKQLDKNDTVDINGIPDARFKKKMRHLLQTVGAEKKGDVWIKPSKLDDKSFKDFFGAIKKPAKKEAKSKRKSPSPERQKSPSPIKQAAPVEVIEESELQMDSDEPQVKRPRTKGPAMPKRDEDGNFVQEDSDDSDDGAGPLPEGMTRKEGVDFDELAKQEAKPKREGWMLNAPKYLGGFEDDKKDAYTVTRSKEEQELMDRQIAEHKKKIGTKSLLEQTQEGKFAEHKAAQEDIKKRNKLGGDERWGMSEKQQEKKKGEKTSGAVGLKRPFDPEKDMPTKNKGMDKGAFEQLVASSKQWGDRFTTGGKASSFL
jgi:hypothetical protein